MLYHKAEKLKIMIIFCYYSVTMTDTFLSTFLLLKTFADLKPGLNE